MRLGTTYLGFELRNPLATGSSPMCDNVDSARELEDNGASMLTLRSLFQEQIASEDVPFSESLAYVSDQVEFQMGPDEYLAHIARLKAAVGVPIVASLNCQTNGSWTDYARLMEQAGADALELNIFHPVVGLDQTSQQIEEETVAVVAAVRAAVKLPLAVKLMPNYTALPHFSRRLIHAGAQALVLFNRLYQPQMDLEDLGLREEMSLSSPQEISSRLRAVASLAGRVHCDLAITGGVHDAAAVLRATLAGANVVQMVSAIMLHGPHCLLKILGDIRLWLDTHHFESLAQVRGSMSFLRTPSPKSGERKNFISAINHWHGSGSTG